MPYRNGRYVDPDEWARIKAEEFRNSLGPSEAEPEPVAPKTVRKRRSPAKVTAAVAAIADAMGTEDVTGIDVTGLDAEIEEINS